jgi:hypothetical protein
MRQEIALKTTAKNDVRQKTQKRCGAWFSPIFALRVDRHHPAKCDGRGLPNHQIGPTVSPTKKSRQSQTPRQYSVGLTDTGFP